MNNKKLFNILILSLVTLILTFFNSLLIFAEDSDNTSLSNTERAILAGTIILICIPLLVVLKTRKINNIKRLKQLHKKLCKQIEMLETQKKFTTSNTLKIKSLLNNIRQSIYSELSNTENYQLELLNADAHTIISNLDNLTYKTIFDKENANASLFMESLKAFNSQFENFLNHFE